MLPFLQTENSITVSYNGQIKIFAKGAEFDRVVSLIKANDERGLLKYLDNLRQVVEKKGGGHFREENGVVFIRNKDGKEDVLPNVLGKRLVDLANQNMPIMHLVKFWHNLNENPSYEAVNRLYDFLEANHHPITDDGHFIAYKKVTSDYKDIKTKKFSNRPGETVKMPRNHVNPDNEITCTNGLHICAWEYLPHYGGESGNIVLEVKVNPRDVVAVPRDYNNSKMRVCEYLVLKEATDGERKDLLYNHRAEDYDIDENEICGDCGGDNFDCDCDPDDEDWCDDCDELLDDCSCGDDHDWD